MFKEKIGLLFQWSWPKLGYCVHPSFLWFFKH